MSEQTKPAESKASALSIAQRGIVPQNLGELYQFAATIVQSGLAPAQFKKAAQVVVAIQIGMEHGFTPMQALSTIAVINGRPALYGDGPLALVYRSGLLEEIDETVEGDGKDMVAICRVKRVGLPVNEARFSWADAEQAGLTERNTNYKTFPRRMIQFRARGFALRNTFPDVLMGLMDEHEARDMPPKQVTSEVLDTEPTITDVPSEQPKNLNDLIDQKAEEMGLGDDPTEEPSVRDPEPGEQGELLPSASEGDQGGAFS